MPNVERLAEKGLTFEAAYANSPVCSAARTTLLLGCYGPRVSTHYHRALTKAALAEPLKPYPLYFREAGYYTANCSKTDYNIVESAAIWDESSTRASYRNREAGQPFFQVWNLHETHESRTHATFDKKADAAYISKPEQMTVFPYHPDTELFRKLYAHYLDQHREADRQMGRFLDHLAADGLMDDTIVFVFGDHGGVLPRSKGYSYESGLRVPLVVSVPQNWQHLFPAPAGSRIQGCVSFVDFAATVMKLAGLEPPEHMDGTPFLGAGITLKEVNQRDTVIGYSDRFDEKMDMVRTLRKGRYKYIRNYQPYYPDGVFNAYRYKQACYREWFRLAEAGALNEVQRAFFERRAPEALYDLESNPHETVNLAQHPAYRAIAESMRVELREALQAMPDLSFYPEAVLAREALADPIAFGEAHRKQIRALSELADLQCIDFQEACGELAAAIQSSCPLTRYWGWMGAAAFGSKAQVWVPEAKEALANDTDPLVRLRALEFLAQLEPLEMVVPLTEMIKQTPCAMEQLTFLQTAAWLQLIEPVVRFDLGEEDLRSGSKLMETLLSIRLDYVSTAGRSAAVK
jgi:arylsulfatase A-like enzyme